MHALLHEDGHALKETIIEGSADRLNPILMTALASALALIPLAMAAGEDFPEAGQARCLPCSLQERGFHAHAHKARPAQGPEEKGGVFQYPDKARVRRAFTASSRRK